MSDENTFKFENYDQGQTMDLGTEQAQPSLQGDTQFFNQNEVFSQGENDVLQESAGMGGVTVNDNLNNQHNTFQENTMDTNAIFGETLKTGTETSDFNFQNFQETATNNTNAIEGNNFFEDTAQTQVKETNIDPNAFFSNENFENIDTNALFNQAQEKQATTETTTETKTFFNQTEEIQPQFGEPQVIQGTDANTFLDANPQDFGQIQPQTQQQEGQDIYDTYQATNTQDLNSIGYGTTESQPQPVFTPPTQPQTLPPPFFAPVEPVTQTQTTTTTTTTKTTFDQPPIISPATPQFENKIPEEISYEAYPASNTHVEQTQSQPIQPPYDINNFQQVLDDTPLTTSTTVPQAEPQFIPQNQQPVTIEQVTPPPQIVPQPNIQTTYTTIPTPKTKRVVQKGVVSRIGARPVTYIQPPSKPINYVPPQTQSVTYTQPQSQPVAYTQPQSQPVAYTQPQSQPVTYTQPQSQPVTYTQPQSQPVTYTQPQSQPVTYTQPQSQPVTYTQPQSQPVTYTQPQSQPVAYTQTQSRPVTFTQPTSQSVTYTQTTNVVTPTPTQYTPVGQPIVQQTFQTSTATIPTQTQYVQPGQIPGYQYINKLIDEDFKRGRPIYNENGIQRNKLRLNNNQVNVPTYRIREINEVNKNNIGLSKLAPANSYNNFVINTPTINTPTINTPTINTPTINTPTINTPNINTPTFTNNLVNNINNNINTLNTNIGNNVNNAFGNINTGLDKIGKASSYSFSTNNITPLLNNTSLQTSNFPSDNTRLPQLKDFL